MIDFRQGALDAFLLAVAIWVIAALLLSGCTHRETYDFMSAMQRGVVGASYGYADALPRRSSPTCYISPGGPPGYSTMNCYSW